MKLFAFILLAIFLVLYGLGAITNFRIDLMSILTGLSALLAGAAFIIMIARKEEVR